jgi:NAD(P)-dependent dehydrogenase (short-subunit alcohol dehydrogenase family)
MYAKEGLGMNICGQTAIITGAARGIGKAAALVLAQHGANIAICGPDLGNLRWTVQEAEKYKARVLPVQADVSKKYDVQHMVGQVIQKFGCIDILINNAGVISLDTVENLKEEEWDRVYNINTKGTFLCSQAVIPQMRKQKKGRIINIASACGKTAAPLMAHYCASKAAVIMFTHSLALELAPDILVNCICPGNIDTDMTYFEAEWHAKKKSIEKEQVLQGFSDPIPLKRMGTPEDIANAILFLCSEYSNYIHNQSINVCGGLEQH